MNHIRTLILTSGLLSLAACDLVTPKPDYTIRVVPGATGMVAVPPECPSWNTELAAAMDNQPLPQFGCANARNLASLVENPKDLVMGRDLGDGRGTTAVGTIRRYDNNQPRGLLMPVQETSSTAATTAPVAGSAMTGEIVTPSTGASTPAP